MSGLLFIRENYFVGVTFFFRAVLNMAEYLHVVFSGSSSRNKALDHSLSDTAHICSFFLSRSAVLRQKIRNYLLFWCKVETVGVTEILIRKPHHFYGGITYRLSEDIIRLHRPCIAEFIGQSPAVFKDIILQHFVE